MDRKTAIQSAYKSLGKEATFYDGMITCSTIPGKAVCKVVWNMCVEENTRYHLPGLFRGYDGSCPAQGRKKRSFQRAVPLR